MLQRAVRKALWLAVLLSLLNSWGEAQSPVLTNGDDAKRCRAVLVGVGHYKNSAWPPLEGPLTDVSVIKETLSRRFALSSVELLDQQASIENIVGQLNWLVESPEPADVLLFYYSGHGCQLPDDNGDELTDGMDEAIIPYDALAFDTRAFAKSVIRDDVLQSVLARGVAAVRRHNPNGQVVFIFDSCHSGSMSREFREAGVSTKTNPLVQRFFQRSDKKRDVGMPDGWIASATAPTSGWVTFSACSSDQPAKAAADKGQASAFTAWMAQAFDELDRQEVRSYRVLSELITISAGADPQIPTAAGDLDMPIFGNTRVGWPGAVRVKSVDIEGSLVSVGLDRGTLAGLSPGSKVALYKPTAATPGNPAQLLAVASIVPEVLTAYSCRGQYKVEGPVEVDDLIQQLHSAIGFISTRRLRSRPIKVAFSKAVSPTSVKGMKLKLAEHAAEVEIVPRSRRPDLLFNEGGPRNSRRLELVSLVTPGNVHSCLAMGQLADKHFEERIDRAIKTQVIGRYLQDLTFHSETCDVDVTVVAARKSGTKFEESPKPPYLRTNEFLDGESALIRIINRGSTPLYIACLSHSPDGSVVPIYPAKDAFDTWEKLGPKQVLRTPEGDGLVVDTIIQRHEVAGLQVIGTDQQIDWWSIVTDGRQRATEEEKQHPLREFLETFGKGNTRQVDAPGGYAASPVRWLRIKRRVSNAR